MTQEVPVYRLDSLLDQFANPADRIYLKIDTQGYEQKILNEALGIINRCELIQLETPFFEVYHAR
ncbi:MAG: FkbM family methyltransferase [Methylocella sp.]